jgi:hypothetical protein
VVSVRDWAVPTTYKGVTSFSYYCWTGESICANLAGKTFSKRSRDVDSMFQLQKVFHRFAHLDWPSHELLKGTPKGRVASCCLVV